MIISLAWLWAWTILVGRIDPGVRVSPAASPSGTRGRGPPHSPQAVSHLFCRARVAQPSTPLSDSSPAQAPRDRESDRESRGEGKDGEVGEGAEEGEVVGLAGPGSPNLGRRRGGRGRRHAGMGAGGRARVDVHQRDDIEPVPRPRRATPMGRREGRGRRGGCSGQARNPWRGRAGAGPGRGRRRLWVWVRVRMDGQGRARGRDGG